MPDTGDNVLRACPCILAEKFYRKWKMDYARHILADVHQQDFCRKPETKFTNLTAVVTEKV